MLVSHNKLRPETLRALIEEFVTRPGTDTGYVGGTLEDSVDMVMKQLRLGDVFIVYDEETETANIVPKELVINNHPNRE